MPDFAQYAPLIVPVLVGLVVLRLLVELLLSLARRGPERAAAVRGAWGRYLTAMFLSGFLLPFLTPVLRVPLNTTPIWVLLVIGGILGALHNSVLTRSLLQASSPARPSPAQQPQAAATANPQNKARSQKKPGNPSRPAVNHPAAPSAEPVAALFAPDLPVFPVQTLATSEPAIGKLPMPPARKVQANPLPSDQAESWYERQNARLERTLQGKELAAARLRLSTVKSMLLLGQIGTGEADNDVNMVLRQAGQS